MTDIFRCSSVLTENERLFSAEGISENGELKRF